MSDTHPTPTGIIETCDCGGDYPCSHGAYVYAFHLDEPQPYYAERAEKRGEEIPSYAYTYSEVVEFPDWLVTRILLSTDLVNVLTDLVSDTPPADAAQRGRDLLARLAESPVDVVWALQEQSQVMCPHCGKRYSPCAEIPTHDWPFPTRQVCPGSGKAPRSPEDQSPLGNGEMP